MLTFASYILQMQANIPDQLYRISGNVIDRKQCAEGQVLIAIDLSSPQFSSSNQLKTSRCISIATQSLSKKENFPGAVGLIVVFLFGSEDGEGQLKILYKSGNVS